MPWPDGLEYAAAAVNLDRGLGPVLHFGGYSYPSRYTEGYPLILAAAYPILGHDVELLCLATMVMGLVAIVALYLLAFRMFGRPSAFRRVRAARAVSGVHHLLDAGPERRSNDDGHDPRGDRALSCERGRGCAAVIAIMDCFRGAVRSARGIHRDDPPHQRDDADRHRHGDVHRSLSTPARRVASGSDRVRCRIRDFSDLAGVDELSLSRRSDCAAAMCSGFPRSMAPSAKPSTRDFCSARRCREIHTATSFRMC